jgi:hypothetical protein
MDLPESMRKVTLFLGKRGFPCSSVESHSGRMEGSPAVLQTEATTSQSDRQGGRGSGKTRVRKKITLVRGSERKEKANEEPNSRTTD